MYAYHGNFIYEDGTEEMIDLSTPGWYSEERIARTRRLTLIPRDGENMPVLSVLVPDGGRVVFKVRAMGHFGIGFQGGKLEPDFRCYALGYARDGQEFLTWVLPTGMIEIGEEPQLAHEYIVNLFRE